MERFHKSACLAKTQVIILITIFPCRSRFSFPFFLPAWLDYLDVIDKDARVCNALSYYKSRFIPASQPHHNFTGVLSSLASYSCSRWLSRPSPELSNDLMPTLLAPPVFIVSLSLSL
jgi:hypothetical protein